ncbi:hypothetical protein RND71_001007 [Anisodus tanguticus]|uniref:VQ domain-containing protein n=1 Tax=Anisodus tanguticus TaxID=243964 RepID=A0AAE1T0J7_9SOLA|nr:hypothetical protein RND71_001007 [Anisodus tanguticus]
MMMKCKNNKKQRKRDDHNSKKSSVKVVYISTPMKVKSSASRFRSLVQELTGRDSDIARIMENNGATEFEDIHHGRGGVNELPAQSSSPSPSSTSSLLPAKSSDSSPVGSDSNYFVEPNFDDLFSGQMEDQFLSLLASSNYFPPSCSDYSAEIDVLVSYDAL